MEDLIADRLKPRQKHSILTVNGYLSVGVRYHFEKNPNHASTEDSEGIRFGLRLQLILLDAPHCHRKILEETLFSLIRYLNNVESHIHIEEGNITYLLNKVKGEICHRP